MQKRFWLANLLCLGAAFLIVASFSYPIWSLAAKARQYETEFPQGLMVHVYLSTVKGELYEFELFNKWIGAHFPLTVPEHVIAPIAFGGVALLCVASIFLNHWKERAVKWALILFMGLGVVGAGSLQWRLYAFGHFRNPNAYVSIPDFTVPILGSVKLQNWNITAGLDIGAYTLAVAGILVALAYLLTFLALRKQPANKGEAQ